MFSLSFVVLAVTLLCAPGVLAQSTAGGAVSVAVVDSTGATVPEAELELRDISTNDVRRATTQTNGVYTFPNLRFGTYELKVAKQGFATQVFNEVLVQTARTTTVNVTLQVATTVQTVQVTEAATPIVEVDSSTLASTIDTKQVVNLPLVGRNVMSLAFLVPGWASRGGPNSSDGTWNNLPGGAVVGTEFDGVPGISNRFRSGGFNYGTTAVQPRIEDVAEMTVQTAQLDLGGIGSSAMRVAIVGRRGSNAFHGRLFEDFRNTVLNANSWSNNARRVARPVVKRNEFGGNVGGPIKRDKAFFFFTWSTFKEPGTNTIGTSVLNPGAQQGNFTYTSTAGATTTVNVLQIAGAAGHRATVHPNTAAQFQKINGVLNQGSLTQGTDPNVATLNFQNPRNQTTHFPTIRGDYVFSDNLRFNLSYSQQKNFTAKNYAPQYPGGIDPLNETGIKGNNRIANVGVDWTIRPTLINQFRGGYMYQYSAFSPENLGLDLPNIHRENWGYSQSLFGNAYPRRAISSFYPLLNANDNLIWQRGAHTFTFGGSWYTEHDHYWNGAGGEPNYNYGIVGQDPLSAVFTTALANAPTTQRTQAMNLYAQLTQRISSVNIGVGRPVDEKTKQYKPYGAYNLNELVGAVGFWAQDRWRIKPNLTVNYGLRWDWVGDNYAVNGLYSAPPSLGDLWGPTPVGQPFKPGTLGGVANPVFQAQQHAYEPNTKNFSPAIALAWSPNFSGGILEKLFGKDKTVIRTGYSLRYYTEGAQNFWAFASNSGQFFFQQGSVTANPTVALGNFAPGTLFYGDPLPAYLLSPPEYATTVPARNLFARATFWAMNRNIQHPYVEQWNFGIQRQLGAGSALEIRYVGNLSLHQWLGYNINETNIFENGFLPQFQAAQNNLAINRANGRGNSFANNGLPGQVALPIFAAAFGPATANYTSGALITNLDTGAAGTMANSIANNATFFCNMVGTAAFPACADRGVNVPGAGYPINFFNVNPFATGRTVNYLDSAGKSNYHALQVEFRQRPTKGAQFNIAYTWAKSLGIAAQNGIQGQGNNIYYTARNFRLNRSPSLFDIRHVFRTSGTYDLPFGKGRAWLNQGAAMDRIFGGWTLGTIITLQTGNPAQFSGGYGTLNTNDSGIVLNGITRADLQNAVKVQKLGSPWVQTFDPKFIAANGSAVTSYLQPNTTPGTWGYRPYIWGPGWYNIDLSVNKSIPVRESIKVVLQTQFLNLFNHTNFGLGGLGIQSISFGQSTGGAGGPRVVEFRLNVEF
jgi:hypothetical protein